MDGFLYVDKPIGMTSHDVVAIVKRQLKLDRIGHTGTLDPFASGLLILCVGKATKLAYLFSNQDKDYTGTIAFGIHYDSYDITGNEVARLKAPNSVERIAKEVSGMIGTYMQLPPMHSAIKVGGKKLYELARQGVNVLREKREVTIRDFKLTSPYENDSIDFFASVSKGTYIRSLAVDLGERLNTYAALSSLRRTRIGDVSIEDAVKLHDIKTRDIFTLEHYFKDYPKLILSDYLIHLVRNGVYLDDRQIETDHPFVVFDEMDHMIAYYEPIRKHTYKPILIF